MFAPSQSVPLQPAPPPLVVQILGTLTFGAFAIVATVMAFATFWAAGLAVAVTIVLFGFGRRSERGFGRRAACPPADEPMVDITPDAAPTSTGNARFDAYRAEVLKRLEDEQASFVAFLDRLRAARDQVELDAFMAEHTRVAPTPGAASGTT